jgi:metal-dependent amidase/aminoacylase/carboxypeptidase family protein
VDAGGKFAFDVAAAAETPHGAADFVDEAFFEDADRAEFLHESSGELRVGEFLAWEDEVVEGEEAVRDRVLR